MAMDKKNSSSAQIAQDPRQNRGTGAIRLCVHRSNSHIYAQIIDATGGVVLTSASSAEKELREQIKNGGNVEAAKIDWPTYR
jgi:large subunit ribosomal protein L18